MGSQNRVRLRENFRNFFSRKPKNPEPKSSGAAISAVLTSAPATSLSVASQLVPQISETATSRASKATTSNDEPVYRPSPSATNENTSLPVAPAATTSPEDTTPLQSEIWNEAYDGLREDEQVIVEAYERILSGQIETGAASAIEVEGYHENAIETASRQDQLKKLPEDGQARTEKISKIKGKIKGVVEPFDKLRVIISLAVNTEPAAATAWTGITAVLDILASPLVAVVFNYDVWIWNLSQPAPTPLYQKLPHETRTCSFAIDSPRLLVDGGAVAVSSLSGVGEGNSLVGVQDCLRYKGYGISVDSKWITRDGQNLLYLPGEYRVKQHSKHLRWRERVSFQDSMVAFAVPEGPLYLLQF